MSQRPAFRMAVALFAAVIALSSAPAVFGMTTGLRLSTRQHPGIIEGTFNVNFDRWASGQYTFANASADFGDVSKWDEGRTTISNGRLKAQLEPNKIGEASGMYAQVRVADGIEYEMQYTVNFHSQFDWSRGGKLGWGFKFGDNANGCKRADGDGASMRLMWYTNGSGRTFFMPYLYYATMPSNCGDSFGLSYPPSQSLQRSTNYVVYMYVKSNTANNRDGRAIIKIDGNILIDTPIQWTDNDAKAAINGVLFQSFRGGTEDYWAADTIGYIYYDNFSVRRLS